MSTAEVIEAPTNGTTTINNDAKSLKIIRQVEYYFGDVNLARDKFMQEELKKDNGWFSLNTLTKFNRLKEITTDFDELISALKKSQSGLLEVDEQEKKIRRVKPLPEKFEDLDTQFTENTVYVKGFPETLTLDDFYSFFEKYGKVIKVFMRRVPSTKKFSGKVFITFETIEETKSFLEIKELKYNENELQSESQKDYVARKQVEIEAKKSKKKQKNDNSATPSKEDKKITSTESETEKRVIQKGATIYVKGLNDKCSRENLKELFDNLTKVQWITYNRGEPEAYIRFEEANSAKDTLEQLLKLKDDKIVLQGSELECRVIEGEDEEKYIEREREAQIKSKQSGGGGGRRGRGNNGKQGGYGKGKYNANKRKSQDNDNKNGENTNKKIKAE